MKVFSTLFLATAATAAAVPAIEKRVSYNGFKTVRIATHDDAAAVEGKLGSFPAVRLNIDTKEHMDLAIPGEDIQTFEALGLDAEIIDEDFGALIAAEGPLVEYKGVEAMALPDLEWWNNYHAYIDHVQFFKDLQAAFPNNSEIVSAGSSYEGRDLYGMHLWGKDGKDSKRAIYFHGNVHAREWVTAMVVEYLTYKLIEGYGTDVVATNILDNFDFFIFPVINPDGFVYTQTTDRLWRKNRQVRPRTSCIGTDENRNWPHFKWSAPGGASTSSCSEVYKGEAPGDSPEMQGLVAFTQKIASTNGIKLFIDWHSYGQYILLPYGYDCSKVADNNDLQMKLAKNTADTIRAQRGSTFTYGPSCQTLYATTGDSTDYMTDEAGAEFAWTIELPPASGRGASGFILPANQVLPASMEQWEAMRYLLPSV